MNWTYSQPVKIIFGNNTVEDLHKILEEKGLSDGLLVTDPIFTQNGFAQRLMELSNGRITHIFDDITPNPTVQNVDDCAQIIRENKLNFIIALGGGSSIDCSKAAASVALTEFSVVEFHSGQRKFTSDHLPLIVIPTTAGTGSEVTSVAVLTDYKKSFKGPIGSSNFFPDIAIIDPILTLSVPKRVTASTGLDVLAHALEGFWSKGHQPICDALALYAAKLCFEYLPGAFSHGEDIIAREKMCEASVIAGLAFALPKTAASHACSFPLTNLYNIPHGEACAFTLDYFTRINAKAEDGRLNNFAKQIGFKDADDMADRIFEMKSEMGMTLRLGEKGIKEDEIENIAKLSMHPNMQNNPVEMTLDMIIEMYKKLY
jgi:alcohol dehydrogenase